jgi:hypothetical protein
VGQFNLKFFLFHLNLKSLLLLIVDLRNSYPYLYTGFLIRISSFLRGLLQLLFWHHIRGRIPNRLISEDLPLLIKFRFYCRVVTLSVNSNTAIKVVLSERRHRLGITKGSILKFITILVLECLPRVVNL